jgi:hypothetical protein
MWLKDRDGFADLSSRLGTHHRRQKAPKAGSGIPRLKKVLTMRKMMFVLAAIGLVSMFGLAEAGAVDYPATTGPLTVTPSTVNAGDTVTVKGGGFAPGATVQISIASTPTLIATVGADGSGSFSTTAVIPASIESGVHTVSATAASPSGGSMTLTATVTVNGASQPALAFTGSNSAALAGVAIAVIAVGALFVGVTRRRSTTKA